MISTSEFKPGIAVVLEGELWKIIEFQHVKPGKGGAFVRTKLRNMKTDRVLERTFKAGDKVQEAFIEMKNLQYLYRAGELFHFMDTQTYEETVIEEAAMGDAPHFIVENMEINVSLHNGQIIGVEPPTFVELNVKDTDPGLKGDTAKSGTKPATMETGYIIQVPLFINSGDLIKVDTRNGVYVERMRAAQ